MVLPVDPKFDGTVMHALIIYCHPSPKSFTAAVRDRVVAALTARGATVEILDLYAQAFDPVLSPAELAGYEQVPENVGPVAEEVAALRRCDTLIFVYPTWWYGQPALLKGWLDRVLLPDVAFSMPRPNETIRPLLTHVTRLGVFTTCGASWWLTRLVGAPGKRILLTGLRILCAKRVRTAFAAHYLMDSSSPDSRARHLARVDRCMRRFLA
ncbi:MAG: NAD(P)H-dependent oxidoreductase [Pseudomonadota bacterium]